MIFFSKKRDKKRIIRRADPHYGLISSSRVYANINNE